MSRWRADRPWNDLPKLPPTVELESKAVLKQCITARAALAELKQAAALIPNPAMLINTLPILEARASSEIENVVTTADKLFQHVQETWQRGPRDPRGAALPGRAPRRRARAEEAPACHPHRGDDLHAHQRRGDGGAQSARYRVDANALVRWSIRRPKAKRSCASCWPTGSGSSTRTTLSIRSSAWRSRITSSRPSTLSPTATAVPAAC